MDLTLVQCAEGNAGGQYSCIPIFSCSIFSRDLSSPSVPRSPEKQMQMMPPSLSGAIKLMTRRHVFCICFSLCWPRPPHQSLFPSDKTYLHLVLDQFHSDDARGDAKQTEDGGDEHPRAIGVNSIAPLSTCSSRIVLLSASTASSLNVCTNLNTIFLQFTRHFELSSSTMLT